MVARIRRGLAWSTVALIGLAAIGCIVLATGAGQRGAVSLLARMASGPGASVRVEGLEGSLFSTGQLKRIHVADSNGVWLEIEQIAYSWSPQALLWGKLSVAKLHASQVRVLRRPETKSVPAEQGARDGGVAPIALDISSFEIARLHLAKEVAGLEAHFTASASAAFAGRGHPITARAEMRRIDGTDGTFGATLAYHPDQRRLDIAVAATEPAGGLGVRLIGVPGLPPLKLRLSGRGPIDDWAAELAIQSADYASAEGRVRLLRQGERLAFTGDLAGALGGLVPVGLRDLLAGRTTARVAGGWSDKGRLELDTGILDTDSLQVALGGVFDTPRNFAHGAATFVVGRRDGRAVTAVAGADADAHVTIGRLEGRVTLAPQTADRAVTVTLDGGDISGAFGDVRKLTARVSALQPVPYDTSWQALTGIELAATLTGRIGPAPSGPPAADGGITVTAIAKGQSDGKSLAVSGYSLTAGTSKISGQGRLTQEGAEITLAQSRVDLSALSGLVGHSLGGVLHIGGSGHWRVADRSGVKLDMSLRDPKGLHPLADALLAGETRGRVALNRQSDGRVDVETATLDGTAIKLSLAGMLDQLSQQLQLSGRVLDLSRLDAVLAGEATLSARLDGSRSAPKLVAEVTGSNVRLRGEPVEAAAVKLESIGQLGKLQGTTNLDFRYGGMRGLGSARLQRQGDGQVRVDGIDLDIGGNRLKGWLQALGPAGLDGEIVLDAPKLSALSTMAGVTVTGQMSAKLASTGASTGASAARKLRLVATGSQLGIGGSRIGRFDTDLESLGDIADLSASGHVRLTNVRHESVELSTATLDIGSQSGATSLHLAARGPAGSAEGKATLSRRGSGWDLATAQLRAVVNGQTAALSAPARITLRDGTVGLQKVTLAAGGGQIAISGHAGPQLAISAQITRVQASLADAFAPALAARGAISGKVQVSGPAASPRSEFDLAWTGASVAATQDIGQLAITARGTHAAGKVTAKAHVVGTTGVNLTVDGGVLLAGTTELDLSVLGQVPLTLLNKQLAERGTLASGLAKVDVALKGAPERLQMSGPISIAGAEIRDPASGLVLSDIRLGARLAGTAVLIDNLAAVTPRGGRLNGNGQIALDVAAGYPADLRFTAQAFRIDDRKMLAGSLDGEIGLTGPLLSGPRVAGTLRLQRFDIAIPERMSRSLTELEIQHRNISPARMRELGIKPGDGADAAPVGPSKPVELDLLIIANGGIYVRGRGLDARLGGRMRLAGSSDAPTAEGEFQMERGYFGIVGRRLTFSQGTIGFEGSLDPTLNFVATSDVDGTRVTATITGRASNPVLRFSSSPELPEDEVLARLLFNKSLAKLSPLQIAHLATEIDRLGGLTSGPGVLGQLRKSIGVDVLDVTTDKKGNAAVTAGSYINDKVYVGVQQNTGTNDSRVVIDLDITKNIKARAETGRNGDSKVGIGVEWNY